MSRSDIKDLTDWANINAEPYAGRHKQTSIKKQKNIDSGLDWKQRAAERSKIKQEEQQQFTDYFIKAAEKGNVFLDQYKNQMDILRTID